MRIQDTKRAAAIHRNIMQEVEAFIAPGLTLLHLDEHIKKRIEQCGGEPGFLGYKGYPATSCLSVNDVAVHGIPNEYELKDGDIIDVDFGVRVNGWNVDAARTIYVGSQSEKPELVTLTEMMCHAIIEQVRDGASIADLADCGQEFAQKHSLNIMTQYCGHGIGKTIHQDPMICHGYNENLTELAQNLIRGNYSRTKLKEGAIICIEPVCTFGVPRTRQESDGWTERSVDGSNVAHHENTLIVTKNGSEVIC